MGYCKLSPSLPAGKPVIVVSGGGLPGPGYTLIADESVATDVWRALTSQVGGGRTAALRTLRINQKA